MTKITIKFRDDEARAAKLFLQAYYGKNKNTSLETLAKMAIRQVVAVQAQKELYEAMKKVEAE
jgi:hypothetical protein